MPKWLLACAVLVFWVGSALAEIAPFGEFWNNVAYYDTNIEKQGFTSVLGRFEGKLGLNLLENPLLQVYGAYYTAASQSEDYWDNYLYTGPGIRIRPFVGYKAAGWYDEWIPGVKFYYEALSASYYKNTASGEANKRSDTRYGLDLWHEWNLDAPNLDDFWGELWSNLSFRSTNFDWTDFNGYIFYFQPKLGRHLGQGVEVYLRGDLTTSDKTSYWLNVMDYGLGIRLEPWRETANPDEFIRKFKIFAEALSISYLKDKPTDPNKTVSSDFRVGVDFSWGR